MQIRNVKKLLAPVLLGASLLVAGCGGGQESSSNAGADVSKYPEKPITMIVTHSAGGDTDYNARLLARLLEKELGQPVVPNNVTGANGSIALEQYKDGENDGYTIIATNSAALTGNKATGLSDFSFESFEPIAVFGKQAGENVLVPASSPYNNIKDLVEASKANPGQIKYGVSMGGAVYVSSVILDKSIGAKFNVVDVGDASQRMTSLLGNHVDVTSVPYSIGKEYVESGQLKSLGTLFSKRVDLLPEIPALSETYPELYFDTLYVILAPKGTDPAIVEKLNKATLNIVNTNPEYKAEVEKMNFQSPWALDVAATKAELQKQYDHLMEFAQYLQ